MNSETITLLFLLFAIIMFAWEKIPLSLTSMIICIGLVVTNVLEPDQAFNGFINNNVILFVSMFIIGGALFETGMANKIGSIVIKFAKTERQLIVAIMIIVGLMSGILSNTGTAAVLIPVVIGISLKSGFAKSRLLMPLVMAAAMGGNLSLIGAPGNMIAQTALQEKGLKFSFFEYSIVGMPILIIGIVYFAFIGIKFLPNNQNTKDESVNSSKDYSKIPKWKQYASLAILILTILCMVFEDQIGIKLHIVGAIGAIMVVLIGVITEKQAYESIDLKTIFLFGGTLALASALQETGAGNSIANFVMNMIGENASPRLIMFALFIIGAVLTNFMSNTATTALLVPIGISIATNMNADPRAVMMAIVIGCSVAYATPIGMPANAMVLSAGGYKFRDYVKAGLPLIVIATAVSMILLPIFFPFFP
jgi:anion transporter